MFAAQSTSSLGVNWYDFVVLVVLLFGLWSGVRAGLSSELIATLGLLLVILLAPTCYPPVGAWIQDHSRFAVEHANLLAFVAIAVVIYGLTVILREFTRRRRQRRAWPALIETVGGGLAGILRLAVFMTCVTILL
ncbi:CvpA family protein, partial [bacterium]|nr:CvpA family protein [bacterium]